MSNNFVVYKSSAGSGKTYTLVKEYLKLALADPHRLNRSFRQILAVTFTNKAAAEMKERILSALQQISSGEKVPLSTDLQTELKIHEDDLRARCEELHSHLLHQYADFSVCTIDSFVYRIVKRFSTDLQLPANFSVETDEETALWWAIDTLLTDMQQNKTVQQLLLEYTSEKIEEDKNWKVEEEIFTLARSILISKKDAGTGLLGQQEIDNLVEVKKLIKKKTKEIEDHLAAIADKAYAVISQKNISPDDFRHGKNGVFGYFRKLKEKNFDEGDLLKTYVIDAIRDDKWYTDKKSNAAIDSVTAELRQIFKEAEAYRAEKVSTYYLYLILQKNINALCVLSELDILVKQYKTEKNIVFISEFNKAVAGFIRAEPVPFIYERLGDRYKNYLIDEFQDTSNLQWLNLLPLVHNSLSEGKFCMLVGDGKQSIYRWRGADITQFVDLPKIENKENNTWIEEQQQALESNYEEKQLNTNRRSCKEIISFNNKLFNFLSDKFLEGHYKKVYNNSAQEATGKEKGKITLSFIKEESEVAEEKVLSETLKRIYDSLAKKYNYSDIAVLVRKNTQGNLLANYLLQNGVPVVSSDSLLLKNCPEVNFIVTFLTWLINRHDAVAAGAILGYLQKDPKLEIQHEHFKQPDLIKIFASRGINIHINSLAALPLFELCTGIVRVFNLQDKNALYLNFFLDEIANFSLKESNSVFSFLQWWKLKGAGVSVKIPQNTNAVRILTIHGCKGLEFPVVIFSFADWRTQGPEAILIDTHEELPALPVALVKTENNLKKTKFKEQAVDEEQKQQLDNLNLLYVACTRAVEELHILARENNRGVSVSTWLKSFIQEIYPGQLQENVFEIGEDVISEHKKVLEMPSLKPSAFRPLHEAVTIKLSDQETGQQSRRLYGIALHSIFEEVRTASSVVPALQKALLLGNINEEQFIELQKMIDALITHPLLATYFSEGVEIKTETELFLQDGEIIRPDRIVICPDHIAVIDLKTGEKRGSHSKQILQYKNALGSLTKKKVKAFLVYLPGEVVELK